ncbi:MAG TPA: hypothetical protein VLY03_04010 [Bacteroidota bacterium]|nr:hypothetical protein [Bacteroidota bacterium]
MNRRRIAELIGLFFLLVLAAYVYIGFFHPDPYYVDDIYVPRAKLVLLLLRVLFPIIIAILVFLIIGVRRGKFKLSQIILAASSMLFAAIIIYPFANNFFQKHYLQNVALFHPYLQLAPHDFTIRSGERKDKYVIVCLGGSTTEFKDHQGIGWCDMLDSLLRDAIPGKTVEVYDQGRQWYTMQHSLFNYEVNIRPKHPDMIIVMQAINDLAQNADFAYFSHGSFRDDYGHFYGPINRVLERESLFDYCWTMVKGCWYHKPRTIVDTDHFPGLPAYENKLRTIVDLAQHDSTAVVVMTEAFLFKKPITDQENDSLYMLHHETVGPEKEWSLETALRGMSAYDDVCRKVAAERHLLLVDLEKTVPKSLRFFYDEVHYQDTTHMLVAKTIAGQLRASGLLH